MANMAKIRDYIRAIATGLSSESTQDFYNRFAGHYDQTFTSQPEVAADMVEYIKGYCEGFSSALDIGCGTGILTKNLEEICGSVYGLDFSAGQIYSAKNKLEKTCLVNGDALSLPFEEESFELVTTLGMVRHLYGREQEFAREVYRVTKSNGIFLMDPQIMVPVLDLFYPLIKETYARFYNYFMRRRNLEETVFGRTTDEWADILTDAGFHVTEERKRYSRDYVFVMGIKKHQDTPADPDISAQPPGQALSGQEP